MGCRLRKRPRVLNRFRRQVRSATPETADESTRFPAPCLRLFRLTAHLQAPTGSSSPPVDRPLGRAVAVPSACPKAARPAVGGLKLVALFCLFERMRRV